MEKNKDKIDKFMAEYNDDFGNLEYSDNLLKNESLNVLHEAARRKDDTDESLSFFAKMKYLFTQSPNRLLPRLAYSLSLVLVFGTVLFYSGVFEGNENNVAADKKHDSPELNNNDNETTAPDINELPGNNLIAENNAPEPGNTGEVSYKTKQLYNISLDFETRALAEKDGKAKQTGEEAFKLVKQELEKHKLNYKEYKSGIRTAEFKNGGELLSLSFRYDKKANSLLISKIYKGLPENSELKEYDYMPLLEGLEETLFENSGR